MTASESRHREVARGVTSPGEGVSKMQQAAMAPRPKKLLQTASQRHLFQEALGVQGKCKSRTALSWQHGSDQGHACLSEWHTDADDAHAQAG
jgi:hypothetical protein